MGVSSWFLLLAFICVSIVLISGVNEDGHDEKRSLQPQRFTNKRHQHLSANAGLLKGKPTYPVKDLHMMRLEIRGTTDAAC